MCAPKAPLQLVDTKGPLCSKGVLRADAVRINILIGHGRRPRVHMAYTEQRFSTFTTRLSKTTVRKAKGGYAMELHTEPDLNQDTLIVDKLRNTHKPADILPYTRTHRWTIYIHRQKHCHQETHTHAKAETGRCDPPRCLPNKPSQCRQAS